MRVFTHLSEYWSPNQEISAIIPKQIRFAIGAISLLKVPEEAPTAEVRVSTHLLLRSDGHQKGLIGSKSVYSIEVREDTHLSEYWSPNQEINAIIPKQIRFAIGAISLLKVPEEAPTAEVRVSTHLLLQREGYQNDQ